MKKIILFALILCCSLQAKAQGSEAQMQLRKLQLAEAAISRFYVDSVKEGLLVETAIKAMLKELDPHSTYSNAEEVKKLNEPLEGSFEGIGISYNFVEDTLMVIQPVMRGPSERVGIQASDRIIAVNDSCIAGVGFTQDDARRVLRGPRGSQVRLDVLRPGVKDILKFTVTRDKIPVKALNAAYLTVSGIGYIQFDSFGKNTHREMMDAIEELEKEGMESLIIDLQGNTGGYLDSAIDIANEFLSAEEPIVYTEGRASKRHEFRANGRGTLKNIPLTILVDQESASAAEILAGAIQDNDRGTIIGRRTYGKGLVQRPVELLDGSMIRLTIARYYTPTGRCIQKPYVKGKKEDYSMDLLHRIQSGELYNEDSVKLDKTLAYQTLKDKRTVYGGGGIMPDFFVPIDTTQYTRYHNQLAATSAITKATLKYIDRHREELTQKYPKFNDFFAHYEVGQDLLDMLIAEGKAQKVEFNEEEYKKGLPEIKLQLKALLARDLWDTSEYFQIMNTINPVVKKAIEMMEE